MVFLKRSPYVPSEREDIPEKGLLSRPIQELIEGAREDMIRVLLVKIL